AALEVLAQLFRAAIVVPAARLRARQPALRRDDDALRVGVQRLGDQGLVGVRAVALRRIDEIDAELDCAAQHLVRVLPIARLAPDVVVVDHPHGAEAEAVCSKVAEPNRTHAKLLFSWIKVSSSGSNAANASRAKSRNAAIFGASFGVLL